VTTIN